jgi:hypothetical protein
MAIAMPYLLSVVYVAMDAYRPSLNQEQGPH